MDYTDGKVNNRASLVYFPTDDDRKLLLSIKDLQKKHQNILRK